MLLRWAPVWEGGKRAGLREKLSCWTAAEAPAQLRAVPKPGWPFTVVPNCTEGPGTLCCLQGPVFGFGLLPGRRLGLGWISSLSWGQVQETDSAESSQLPSVLGANGMDAGRTAWSFPLIHPSPSCKDSFQTSNSDSVSLGMSLMGVLSTPLPRLYLSTDFWVTRCHPGWATRGG